MSNGKKDIVSLNEEPGGSTDEPGGSVNKTALVQKTFSQDSWQSDYKKCLQAVKDISKYIPLSENELPALNEVIKTFPARIPLYYFSLIKNPLDLSDPIRRQCVPSVEEIKEEINDMVDPLGEEKTSPFLCLVHRYPDRVLLLVSSRCFMYCRHCTRKRLWRNKIPDPSLSDIEKALDYVRQNRQIREIVVSGGDPLTLSTERLDYILSVISHCENVEVVRIGTRAPVVFPKRIDDTLCSVLERYRNIWINVQFNHPREITPQSTDACRKLQKCGIPVSNQSVLLRDINDTPSTMMELCHRLQGIRIRPYYLFQCDPVIGAAHFRTSIWRGIEIMEKMRGHSSGMSIPTFVVDGVDGKGKIPLGPNYLTSVTPEGLILRNYKNETFFYANPKE